MKALLEQLFRRYYHDVYRYLYSLCRDVSLAEDLASETFLEVVRSIGSFRAEADIRTWLFTIARRRWAGHLRRRNRSIQTESIHDLCPAAPADSSPGDPLLTQRVSQLLESEPEMQRDIFRMRLEGYSYHEIAGKWQISENSARVICHRLKNRLKHQLETEGYGYE